MKVKIKLDVRSAQMYTELVWDYRPIAPALRAAEVRKLNNVADDNYDAIWAATAVLHADGGYRAEFSHEARTSWAVFSYRSTFERIGREIRIEASRHAFKEWLPELWAGLNDGTLKGRVEYDETTGPKDMLPWQTRESYLAAKHKLLVEEVEVLAKQVRMRRPEWARWEKVGDSELEQECVDYKEWGVPLPAGQPDVLRAMAKVRKGLIVGEEAKQLRRAYAGVVYLPKTRSPVWACYSLGAPAAVLYQLEEPVARWDSLNKEERDAALANAGISVGQVAAGWDWAERRMAVSARWMANALWINKDYADVGLSLRSLLNLLSNGTGL